MFDLFQVMLESGTCCCYPAKALLSCLTKILKTGNSKARALGFTLLEHTIFTELGAVEASSMRPIREYFRCSVCNRSIESLSIQTYNIEDSQDAFNMSKLEDAQFRDSPRLERLDPEKFASVSVSSDKSEGSDTKHYNWGCLDFYRELLCSDDPKLCHTAATHLLKLSPKCSEKVQSALLSKVFYPSFIQAKKTFLTSQKDVSKFIVLSCLSAFSCLMSSISLAETFLSLGGLQHILELMILPPFLRVCCAVLEVIIIVDVLEYEKLSQGLKVKKSESKQTIAPIPKSPPNLSQLTSLVKLIECLEQYTNNLLDKMEVEEQSVEDSSLSSPNRRAELKLLQHVVIFWQTAANLALCSPQLRPFFASHSMSSLGFILLRAILKKVICGSSWKHLASNRDTKSFLFMRLIESVLVFHLTAPPINVHTGMFFKNHDCSC